jgi:hypothetical protein
MERSISARPNTLFSHTQENPNGWLGYCVCGAGSIERNSKTSMADLVSFEFGIVSRV